MNIVSVYFRIIPKPISIIKILIVKLSIDIDLYLETPSDEEKEELLLQRVVGIQKVKTVV